MMYQKLLKIYIKNTFSKGTFGNTKTKKILFVLLMVYVALSIGASLGFMFFSLGDFLNQNNQIAALIAFLGVYALIMPLFMTIFRASGTLFYYKDFSIVGPLPIKSQTIFLAKLTVMMLWIYAGSLLFILPIGFTYFYFAGFDLIQLVYMIVGLIVLPLVPVLLMSLVSLLIGYLSTKTRLGVLFQTVITLVLLIGVMFVQFGFGANPENPLAGQAGLMVLIQQYYFPLKWFFDAIVNQSILDLIYLVIVNMFVFIGGVILFEKLSLKINKTTVKRRLNTNKTVNIQQQPILKTLIKKEFNKFFSIPLYMINVGFGLVILLLGSFASLFFKDVIVETLGSFDFDILLILALAIGFMVTLTFSPAVSLSLEGKNLWVLKSLPIEPKQIMLSKVLFNVLLVTPVCLISILLLGFTLELTVIDILLLTFVIVSLNILSSHLNAIYNLFFPKFDYENEAMVIKQSVSSLLATFGGIALVVTHIGIAVGLTTYFNTQLVLLLIGVINSLLSILVASFLYKSAEKQFRKF